MISVCVTTFNGEKYIREQLNSILSQININDEVIISDDSSMDDTIDIIESLKDSRMRLLKNNNFRSPIFNIENALKNAVGDYIFLADQDDIWLPNKVETVVKYLQKYDCVVSDARIIDVNDNIICDSFIKKNKSRKGFFHNLIKNGYLGCCMAFNKKILKHALPFPANIPMHDMWIGLIAEIFGETLFLNESLISYRRHGLNFSMTSEKSKNSLTIKARFRIVLLFNLIKRIFCL
jgi:glycosyltransferase involved in cell wall biosynthesis